MSNTSAEHSKYGTTGLKAAAVIVMTSVIVSRFTGYLREMLIPSCFGLNNISDAYNIAFLVPDLMYSLLVGGAVSAALIPILAGHIEKGEEADGWKAISIFMNVSFIAMIFLCAVGMIFTPEIISVAAAGYNKSINKADLSLVVNLTRILFPSVAFLMLAGLCNGILNSYRKFAAAAYGPSIYNVFTVLSIFLLSSKDPADNFGVVRVATGIAASSFLYFLIQLAFSLKQMRNYRPLIDLRHSGFKRLFGLALPSLATSSVMQINIIISASFASLFAAGSVTAFKIADRTWQMPLGIIAQGMGVAILPSLSSRFAIGDFERYKVTLSKGLRAVLLLALPSAAGFLVLSEPIIRTAFKFSNRISETDVALTASILALFSFALVAQSMATILNRGFFARNDTKTPLYISSSTIAVNIILNIIFYRFTNLGVTGMALSYSIAALVNALFLLLLLGKMSGGIDLSKLGVFLVRIIPSAAFMGVVLYILNLVMPVDSGIEGIDAMSKIMQFLLLGLQIFIGAAVYFAMTLLLKVEEAISLKNILISKSKAVLHRHSAR